MTEETLYTAVRRLMRELRICEAHGGIMSVILLQHMNTVDIQMDKYKKLEANKKNEVKE